MFLNLSTKIYTEKGWVDLFDFWGPFNFTYPKVMNDQGKMVAVFRTLETVNDSLVIKVSYRILGFDYSVEVTNRHRLLTPDCWKEAGTLTVGERLMCLDVDKPSKRFKADIVAVEEFGSPDVTSCSLVVDGEPRLVIGGGAIVGT